MAGGLLLVDGNACVTQAYYAVSPRLGAKGRFRPPAHRFMDRVLGWIKAEAPAYLAVLFEEPAPSLRLLSRGRRVASRPQMAPELKRELPSIQELLKVAGIPVCYDPPFSVPQLALALVKQAKSKGIPTTLVSTRTSLLQLVQERVTLVNPAREGLRFDPSRVHQLFGISPSAIPDWLSLVGDPAEEIPGAKGIGPKTAAQLLSRHGSVERILNALEQLTPSQRQSVASSLERIRTGYARATIEGIPPSDERPLPPDLSLESLRPRAPEPAQATAHFAKAQMADLSLTLVPHRHLEAVDYRTVLKEEELETLAAQLSQADRFSLDTETTGLDLSRAKLVGISLSLKPHQAFYIPVGHRYPGVPDQLPLSKVAERLESSLADPAKLKIGQNIKFDLLVLRQAGIRVEGPFFDAMIASFLLHPDRRSHSLDILSMDLLGFKMIPIHHLIGPDKTMEEVDLALASEYACEDADVTLQLYQRLRAQLDQSPLTHLFQELEMPFVSAMAETEGYGVLIDQGRVETLLQRTGEETQALAEEIFSAVGRRFNLESPSRLRQVLQEDLTLIPRTRTRTKAFSVSRVSLKRLLNQTSGKGSLPAGGGRRPGPSAQGGDPAIEKGSPVIEKLIRYQDWRFLAQQRLADVSSRLDPVTGRLRVGVHSAAFGTGRFLTSSFFRHPAAEPFEGYLRSLVIAPKGFLLLRISYPQLRWRLLAHYAQAQELVQHLKGPPSLENPRFQRNPNLQEAQGFLKRLLIRAKREGVVSTLLGRIRALHELNSPSSSLRKAAEREAIETILEGSVADLIKLSTVKIWRYLKEASKESRILLESKILLVLEDGLLLEIPEPELNHLIPALKQLMERMGSIQPAASGAQAGPDAAQAIPEEGLLCVPLPVRCETGTRWDRLEPVHERGSTDQSESVFL